ncbi:hypothetical protein [Bacillus mycoides]|uniref:hypothetical protein n=1 Tax=Bacillus mycoides TaxID=1405 RepID=UPI003A81172A
MDKKMKAMPYELKQKLRKYHKHLALASVLHDEIANKLEEYGVPYENVVAEADRCKGEPVNEGLSYINNGEGGIEGSIKMIEEVFLYFVNRDK